MKSSKSFVWQHFETPDSKVYAQEKTNRGQEINAATIDHGSQTSTANSDTNGDVDLCLDIEKIWSAPKKLKEQDEIDLYLDLPQVPASATNFDPLSWWKANCCQLPFLASLCQKYLCRMPSTASVEGIFSMAGNTLGQNRTSLDPEMLNDILVLKRFYLSAEI